MAIILALVWSVKRLLDHLAARRARQSRMVEAEIVEPISSSRPASCRICGTTKKGIGWQYGSTIGVQGGARGWWRRLLGLPPLYVRETMHWQEPEFCADCSHARDTRLDQRIRETNLAVVAITPQMALEHQRFLAAVDDDLRESVTLANRARRIGSSGNGVRALSS